MKKLLSILLPMLLLITMTSCSDSDKNSSSVESSVNITKAERGFSVDGTKLLDANGNEFVMRGVNHAYAWYQSNTPEALDAIAKTGSNTVRIVLSNGTKTEGGNTWTKSDIDSVMNLIDECKALKMIAVLEVHDPVGSDKMEDIEAAAQYWIDIKNALIGQEEYVILNIANEWSGCWETNSDTWTEGYTKVIPKLREAGIKNTILVDAAGWGQNVSSVQKRGTEVFESDPLKNTMFAVHFYGTAGGTAEKIEAALQGIQAHNLCVCVGEFGYDHTDGDVDEDFIMKYCTEKNIGYLAWSWKGNGSPVEYLDIAEDWGGKKLSSDWGEKLINGEYGIKKTSKPCSVFE